MKFVPTLPPPATAPETGPKVKALAGIKRARPVQARISPPLIVQPHARRKAPRGGGGKEEKRRNPHTHGERRIYCRRFERLPMLVELRSVRERRRRNQRASDITEHVDVKA